MDECFRIVFNLFIQSQSSLRNRFARAREIMLILTADAASSIQAENFIQISNAEVQIYISLRNDLT